MLTPEDLQIIYKEHKTSAEGLTSSQIKQRQEHWGKNAIIAKHKKPLLLVFLEEFKDLMVIILIIAAILALIAGEVADGSVILFVVILNATIGFIQEFKAEKAVEALQKMVAPHARVLREGKEMEIDATEVVPGDILVLNEGDSIPADAILIEANELETQESALTGESTPVSKHTQDHGEEEILQSHKENMIFMGTDITHGTGRAIVVSTGMNTEVGHIAKLTSETKKDKSPLEKEMHRIGVFVGKIALAISAALLAIGVLAQNRPFIESLLFASSVAVAAVPEGLPATVTIALAIGVQRLAKKNAIVKQLSASETLGSTTVICSDKTGTLTKNEMTVKEIYLPDHETHVHGVGYSPSQELDAPKNKDAATSFELMMLAATLCNNASLTEKHGDWSILGDPTEGALLTLSAKAGYTKEKLEHEWERVQELTFDSERKRMSVIVKNKKDQYYIFTKGAADNICEIANRVLREGKMITLTPQQQKIFKEKNTGMAEQALRVLAFSFRELTSHEVRQLQKEEHLSKEDAEKNLIMLGLVGMIDPPRREVRDAVEMAKKAHLRIYVITGDHGLTAQAIGKKLDIISDDRKHRIITGVELNKIKDDELRSILSDKELDVIFARVSPEHKLRVVSIFKELGEVVAVTGDGVNDAPALKKADIGIAMGIAGTDVSKEAANMVLADDSFSSIVTAIEEGRTIYNNLKKFVFYMFSCNIGELVTIFTTILIGVRSPLTAILILAVNLGTDILPALALGVDPTEPGIMEQKPRHPKEKIMKKPFIIRYTIMGFVIGIVIIGIYLWTLYHYGWHWGMELHDEDPMYLKGSTVAFVALIFLQMMQAFNSRSEIHSIFTIGFFSNKYLIGAIASSLILTIIMVEVPFFQTYLRTTGLELWDWLIIALASSSILVVEEIRKSYMRKKMKSVTKEA